MKTSPTPYNSPRLLIELKDGEGLPVILIWLMQSQLSLCIKINKNNPPNFTIPKEKHIRHMIFLFFFWHPTSRVFVFLAKITKLISNARTDGFRSVGLPNSKSHCSSLFITFFHFLSLFFTLIELQWKNICFENFSTASWTATKISKRQLISCHTKWEEKQLWCCSMACRLKWSGFFPTSAQYYATLKRKYDGWYVHNKLFYHYTYKTCKGILPP